MEPHPASVEAKQGTRDRAGSCGRILWSFFWKLALGILLFYGALQLWVRTDFFRSRVEKALSELMGMEMRVGRIRATESLNLKIRDLISVSDVAGIEVRVARIRWRWFRPAGVSMLESLRVQGLALTVAPDQNGVLQPPFLGPLSAQVFDWTGIPLSVPPQKPSESAEAEASVPVSGPEPGPLSSWVSWGVGPLSFRDVSIRWQDENGNLIASVSDLNATRMSMELSDGSRVSHTACSIGEVNVERGPRISGLRVEWLEADGRWFLVNLEADDWGGASRPQSEADEYRALLDAMD